MSNLIPLPLAIVATTNTYSDLSGLPTLGTAAAASLTAFSQVLGTGRQTGQTTTQLVASFVPSASVGTYRIGGYLNVTGVTVGTVTLTAAWKDETGAASSLILGQGTVVGLVLNIRDAQISASTGTTITITATVTGTITYNSVATIELLWS